MRAFAVLAAAAGIVPGAAQAQGNDPTTGSPSGKIYEIPLDSARSDAAPRQPSAKTSAAGQPSSQSSIHSADNGFGSSAQVPGVAAPAASAGGGGASPAAKTQPRAKKRSTRLGSGAAGAGGSNSESLIRPAATAAAPSSSRAYVLLALAVGVAGALGAAAHFASRRR